MDNGLCGLLKAHRRVTIIYRHTDATDSPMFSLALILPISDVRCANRPNSSDSAYVGHQLHQLLIARYFCYGLALDYHVVVANCRNLQII